jgi:hypothetical protein
MPTANAACNARLGAKAARSRASRGGTAADGEPGAQTVTEDPVGPELSYVAVEIGAGSTSQDGDAAAREEFVERAASISAYVAPPPPLPSGPAIVVELADVKWRISNGHIATKMWNRSRLATS